MELWIQYSPGMDTSNFVRAGTDADGSPIYVGRADHSGDLLPGKLLISSHRCHVPYNGDEFPYDSSEVLLMSRYAWVPSSDGNVPPNAVIGGQTSTGEPLYVGRAKHCGYFTSGKIHPSHNCLYLAFDSKEHHYTDYQALVKLEDIQPLSEIDVR